MIRENPASRGTEASAKVLVGPPGRTMVWNAGQQQWHEGAVTRSRVDGGPRDLSARRQHSGPSFLDPPLQSASEGIVGAPGLGNLARPESHPEPRHAVFPVQWADPGIKPERLPVIMRIAIRAILLKRTY